MIADEIDALCEDDEDVAQLQLPFKYSETVAELFNSHQLEQLKKQVNSSYQLIIQNVLLSRELGPIGNQDTTIYWKDSLVCILQVIL